LKREFITKKFHSGKKTLEDSNIEKKIEIIEGERFSWIDLQNPDREYVENLSRDYNLNALNVEDCITKFEMPK